MGIHKPPVYRRTLDKLTVISYDALKQKENYRLNNVKNKIKIMYRLNHNKFHIIDQKNTFK